jgi:Tfp pilus assembly pilus retraction ATPase PilT
MAKEILINNSAVANIIRENEIHQLPSILQM